MPCSPRDCANKALSTPPAAWLILAASIISLAFAFIMQYQFGFEPCILCLWQRLPFAVAIMFSILALIPALRHHAHIFLWLCALGFLIGFGLAVFHTGVERHWWLGTSGCAITPLHGGSAADFREQLLSTVRARCEEISWTFLGLSMTNYNIIWSLLLTLFASAAASRHRT